jgi:hypothetical protein
MYGRSTAAPHVRTISTLKDFLFVVTSSLLYFASPRPHFAFPESLSSIASASVCARSIAICVPSAENSNRAIFSDVKCVSCLNAAPPLSGCSHKLSTPFSRTVYTIDFPSGENAIGYAARMSTS